MQDDIIQKTVQKLGNAIMGPDKPPLTRSDREAIEAGMILLANGFQMLSRIADALERSAEAAEGVRPAHDSLDAM